MKIAVLYSSYEQSDSCTKDFDSFECNPSIHVPPEAGYEFTVIPIMKTTAARQIFQLSRLNKYDLYINLCDGSWDEDRAGIEVIEALETFGLPYTGAAPAFYKFSKEHMKMIAHAAGVSTPDHAIAHCEEDIDTALRDLNFPMIVKHFNGFASIGMTRDSKTTNAGGLRKEARRFIDEFGGALIEEYIEGREFTVLVAENPADPRKPIAFEPVECIFSGGETFKHFELKWMKADLIQWSPVAEKDVSEKLKDMSRTMFLGMNGNSYGRCDFRMDKDGNIFFLEMNPNCGIFYPRETYGCADYVLHYDPIGHFGFIKMIIQCALHRLQRKQKKYKISYHKSIGYGLQAAVNISPGEVVLEYEEQPQNLVSLAHVMKTWDQQRLRWFRKYATPVAAGVHGIWNEDPEKWLPINHSCDPNVWLEGLNIVARRTINKGQFLNIDYATICGEHMESFHCGCGTECCRKVVKATDHMELWVTERYGSHVSDYVRQKQEANMYQLRLGIEVIEENSDGSFPKQRDSMWLFESQENMPIELCVPDSNKNNLYDYPS